MVEQIAGMVPKIRFWKTINKHLSFLTWRAVLLIVLLHASASYLSLSLLGENDLVEPVTSFVYFYNVTGSTVGFGDMSPVTEAGKIFVGFFMVPTSIALFGIILTKAGGSLGARVRKTLEGKMSFKDKLQDHTVILGWQADKTRQCIELLRADDPEMEIVLCTEKDIQNPMPDDVHFVKSDMLASDDVLQRAGVATARKILVMAKDDEQALAVTIAAYTEARGGEHLQQMVTYCNTEQIAQLVRNACPTCEAFSSRSVDMMVRACQDPGSTQVHEQMLSSAVGPTQYRVRMPQDYKGTFGDIYRMFKERWNATPLGIATSATGGLVMNPTTDTAVIGEQYIFYIADNRITSQQIQREIT